MTEEKIESPADYIMRLRKENEISIEKVTVTAEAKRLQELEQENKNLYEEKNCLHKIIDRLLENSGYSKDTASAEDFEDVYEDMQIKRNELIELEQENKDLKEYSQRMENQRENYYKEYNKYRSALEEIKNILDKECSIVSNAKAVGIINEVLN